MKTDKKDYFNKIFVGVLILHIIFLYIMPGLKKIVIEKPKVARIRLGDNVDTLDIAPKKNQKKKNTPEIVKKKEVKIVKEKEKTKKENPKKANKKITVPKKILVTQSFDDLEILAGLDSPREIKKRGEDLKPKIIKISDVEEKSKMNKDEDRKLNEVSDNFKDQTEENLDPIEAEILESETEKIMVKKETADGATDIRWDNLMSEENPSIVGPKSGLRVGSIDGKSKVIWDSSNKDPKYPVEAEKNAQTADVKIILDLDADGKVIKVKLIKTGVEIIDRAVESIARDWNIKLINNGMAVSGSVMVEYKFKLKGR